MSYNATDNEDSDDDWFYNSFKRYDDLLMYDIQGSISCATLLNRSRFLLAASGGRRNEVFELSIPKKLIAVKGSGLTRDRDFSVITAGYTEGSIKRMVPLDSGFVASESIGVNYYSIPKSSDGTDIITLKQPIRNDTQDAPVAVTDSKVYSGMSLSSIVSFDLGSENSATVSLNSSDIESVYKGPSSSLISELDFRDGNLYMCLLDTGNVLTYDPRQNAFSHKVEASKSVDGKWTMDVSDSHIATFSSSGTLQVYSNRNLKEPLFTSAIEIPEERENTSSDHICVKMCPNDTFVSVSGLNKKIHVFDFKKGAKEASLFNHDGHRGGEVQNIVTHLWHQVQEKLVFSADDTGQLQAWRFKAS